MSGRVRRTQATMKHDDGGREVVDLLDRRLRFRNHRGRIHGSDLSGGRGRPHYRFQHMLAIAIRREPGSDIRHFSEECSGLRDVRTG